MKNTGAVIVIEDDVDDQELLTEVFRELDYPNEILFFADGEAALGYLNKVEILPY
ncbi:hypothetical protein [Flaviaesturariibacter amylovorans]|uniref:Response regulator n=1 Tax=Flaviaesturariibacter amylovorans TaxID=1084520 RepID=A0ABP8GZY9_9BACT